MLDAGAEPIYAGRMITASDLLDAYAQGYFPMAKSREEPELYWFTPEARGVLPLEGFHLPRSLQKFLRKHPFTLTLNRDFAGVIEACATARDDTWINPEIERLYNELHRMGHAHSVECWLEGALVGGLYGVSLGGAFFGESMFSRTSGASKVALAALVETLRAAGYTLLDTQYVNDHLLQFGVQEIPRAHYLQQLQQALEIQPHSLACSSFCHDLGVGCEHKT